MACLTRKTLSETEKDLLKNKILTETEEAAANAVSGFEKLSPEERSIIEKAIEVKGVLKVGDVFHAVVDDEEEKNVIGIDIFVTSTNFTHRMATLFISWHKPNIKSEKRIPISSKGVVLSGVPIHHPGTTSKLNNKRRSLQRKNTPSLTDTLTSKAAAEKYYWTCTNALQSDISHRQHLNNSAEDSVNINKSEPSDNCEDFLHKRLIQEIAKTQREEINEDFLSVTNCQNSTMDEVLFTQFKKDIEELPAEERLIIKAAVEIQGTLNVGDTFHGISHDKQPVEIEMQVTSVDKVNDKLSLLVNYTKLITMNSKVVDRKDHSNNLPVEGISKDHSSGY